MDIISISAQLILSLSILVVFHECGHFFPAKWFKTKVEKFYLFFNPGFSLWKTQRGETEYGLGWIPFGGYVKIAGMIDESMDTEQMKQDPQPWEFRSKPAWQRLIIMVGGVVVNFILGFLIFAMILFVYGKNYIATEDVKYGIAVDSLGMRLGLMDGDQVIAIDSTKLERFEPRGVNKAIILQDAKTLTVQRDGAPMIINIEPDFSSILTKEENKTATLFSLRLPSKIAKVKDDGVGAKIGLMEADMLLHVNGKATPYQHEFKRELGKYADQTVKIGVLRGSDTMELEAALDETAVLGIAFAPEKEFIDVSAEKYSFFAAIPAGVAEGVGFLGDQLRAFGQMFKGKVKAKDNLGSVISIATLFDASWSWQRFWQITAMLSIILGFFNILPIPALDGGYVMFLLWEVVTGKKPNDRFMEIMTYAGFILLISLMIFALGLDISRLFK